MIAPDTLPFHNEPGGELAGAGLGHLPLQLLRTHPTQPGDLPRVGPDRIMGSTNVYRAKFVFGRMGVPLSLVLEFEQELQGAAHAQFLVQAPLDGRIHALRAPWMAAATIGPVQWPQALGGRALLQQEFAPGVENEQ